MNGSSRSFLAAIRGPIMLIALGSLAAVDNFMGISFWKTWPALLILGGALKLLEHMSTRIANPPMPPGMGGGQ